MAMVLNEAAIRQSGYRWVLLAGLWLVYFSFGLVATSLAPLIPQVRADLGLSNTEIGLILGAWPLIYMVTALPCGVLIDRMQARSGLLLGASFVALSATLRAYSDSGLLLFAATAVLGIGGPLISVGAPKYAASWFNDKQRGLAFGLYGSAPAFGGAMAFWLPAHGLLDWVAGDWQSIMTIYAVVAALAGGMAFAVASWPRIPAPENLQSERPKTSDAIRNLLNNPFVRRLLLVGAGVFFINHGLNNWIAEILRDQGLAKTEVGTWSAMSMVTGVAGLIMLPRLATPQTAQRILAYILVLVAASLLGLVILSKGGAVICVLVLGFLRAPTTAITLFILLSHPSIHARDKGKIGGLFFVASEFGGVLGPLFIGASRDASQGFFLATTGLAIVSVGLAWLVASQRRTAAPVVAPTDR